MTTLKATNRLINSVWTLEFKQISEAEIEIVKYSRDDQEGYDKERELPQCTLIESEGRIVTSVLIRDKYQPFGWVNAENCDKQMIVTNPKHIFSY